MAGLPAAAKGWGAEKAAKVPASQRIKAAIPVVGGPRSSPSVPRVHTPSHPQHNVRPPAPQRPAPGLHTVPQSRPWYEQSPKELHTLAERTTAPEVASARLPYQQREGQLTQTAKTAGERFAGYGNQYLGALDTMKGSADSSAKTFENQVADNQLKIQKEVETAGQNAVTRNAGYLDPQVKAQQESEKANVLATGSAASAAAGQMGQNEQNFLTNMRAAAGMRVTEGEKNIAGHYTQMEQENQNKESQVLQRGQGSTQKEFLDLLTKATGTKASLEKLGISRQESGRKGAETESKIRAAGVKSGVERQNANTHAFTAQENAHYHSASLAEKTRIDSARIKQGAEKLEQGAKKLAQSKGMKPGEYNKTSTGISEAYNTFQRLREKGVDPKEIREALTKGGERVNIHVPAYEKGKRVDRVKSVNQKVPHVGNNVLIKAAEELWNKHAVSGETKAQLEQMGYPTGGGDELFNLLSGTSIIGASGSTNARGKRGGGVSGTA